ncbi:hypothetical protein PROFUN_02022 [Planoprotostelium fungivorum]|uniref:NADPH-dependent FMN reductase-like domain-containing protein n=1 Tax=Planoprotostelium fungivorum TaxID=1890364 RepID=A0A2P6NB63_9EUKA|nr:hypothetical protein PROFUN_02022 [Planoprotostelium fungivorum]
MTQPIPLLCGSHRSTGNTKGVAEWVSSRFRSMSNPPLDLVFAEKLSPVPTHTVEDMAAAITDPSDYNDMDVRRFSHMISSSPAIVIATPQYNWGYPGPLKNTLDHLYHEWKGKPVLLVTLGGHGGGRCAEQLSLVLEGGLKMKVVDTVCITLPSDFIRKSDRVEENDGQWPNFLKEYEEPMEKAFMKLLEAIKGV